VIPPLVMACGLLVTLLAGFFVLTAPGGGLGWAVVVAAAGSFVTARAMLYRRR